MSSWVVTFSCVDRPGIVHAVSGACVATGGNITESQQFSSTDTGRFFIRLEVETPNGAAQLRNQLDQVAGQFDAHVEVISGDHKLRTLVLASKAPHCVQDLLNRATVGTLPIEVPLVLANHPDLAALCAFHQVPFEWATVTPQTKAEFEQRVRQAVVEHDIELVVLARYMQILSPELCEFLTGRAINIHHSFLPGFKGANPYRQAHARGVKLIGATAHFVTSDLDEGPIIEQNVIRVDHSRTVHHLVTLGQGEETRTLSSAVELFAQHRIFLDGVRTVIFR